MIWSWVSPLWGSVSMLSPPPWLRYLTKLKPRGRPPYWYPWNFEIAVSAVSGESKRTTPVPRDRPLGSY